MFRKVSILAVAAIVSMAVVATATAGSQQSYRWGDCNVSVAIAKSSTGRLYGSATMRCDGKHFQSEGWLAVQAIGAEGGASAPPVVYSGLFKDSYGFGSRTLINGYHAISGCVDATADFTAKVSGQGTKTFTSGTSRICP